MTEQPLDDMLGYAGVDQSCAESVSELVKTNVHRPVSFVVQPDAPLPGGERAAQELRRPPAASGQTATGTAIVTPPGRSRSRVSVCCARNSVDRAAG
jgi:hypothetical protein